MCCYKLFKIPTFLEIKRKKGKREVKNLECSINFDTRGVGSSRVRGQEVGGLM